MLSREENAYLTQVGAGTPAGELLRRYWHPVAVAGELTQEKPIKAVRILGENLVVFRDTNGRYGLVAERCPHRSASLAYGRVDAEGIRCPYHGWKFDHAGHCLQQPAESPESTFKDRIRTPAYPVQKLAGLLYAYLGPEPVPLLPRWDVLAREDGKRWTVIDTLLNCNWLQPMENSVDPAHLFWLHGDSAHLVGHSPDYGETHDFIRFEYGIIKRRTTPGKKPGDPPLSDEHPLVFPSILRHVARFKKDTGFRHNLQIRVPVDDTHTQVYRVNFVPNATDRSPADQDPPFEHCELKGPDGRFNMTMVPAQDAMAWETQGGVTDRSQENIGASDIGVITLRKLLKEQIDIVRDGGEPMGVVRDPEKNKVIHFDVINERIGLCRPTDKKVA
jgi:5,5'-dehydrodivanillate O-demethylase oxygenase subunit